MKPWPKATPEQIALARKSIEERIHHAVEDGDYDPAVAWGCELAMALVASAEAEAEARDARCRVRDLVERIDPGHETLEGK